MSDHAPAAGSHGMNRPARERRRDAHAARQLAAILGRRTYGRASTEVLANIRGWGQELGNFTKSSVTGLQSATQNIQALTLLIVGAGAAWVGYKVAVQNATRGQADALTQLRAEQEAHIKNLAEIEIAGRQRYQTGD